eukprot:432943_1
MKAYDMNNNNIINTAKCYSFPLDVTNNENNNFTKTQIDFDNILWDDLNSTHTYSVSQEIGNYDVCVFIKPVQLSKVYIQPRLETYSNSANLTLNLYGNILNEATFKDGKDGKDYNFFKLTEKLWSIDIIHKDINGDSIKWPEGEIIDIDSTNFIFESICQMTDLTFPFIHGEFYMVLQGIPVSDYSLNLQKSIELNLNNWQITNCPVNTIQTISNNGIISCERCAHNSVYIDSECKMCPYHRQLKDTDSSWCSVQECEYVIINHEYDPHKIDGVYNRIGKYINTQGVETDITLYMAWWLKYAILYNQTSDQYFIANLKNWGDFKYTAQRSGLQNNKEEFPFLIDNTDWIDKNDENTEIKMYCPYQYGIGCESMLNNICVAATDGSDSNWLARYNSFDDDTLFNNLKWSCYNEEYLTTDLLNYKMDYERDNDGSIKHDIIQSINQNDVENILSNCKETYIATDIQSICSVTKTTGEIFTFDNSIDPNLSGDDEIKCSIYPRNENGKLILYKNMTWAVRFAAVEKENQYFPKQVRVFVDDEKMYTNKLTVPNCKGNWIISLIWNQHMIDGSQTPIIIWSYTLNEINDKNCVGYGTPNSNIYRSILNEKFIVNQTITYVENITVTEEIDGDSVDSHSQINLVFCVYIFQLCYILCL